MVSQLQAREEDAERARQERENPEITIQSFGAGTIGFGADLDEHTYADNSLLLHWEFGDNNQSLLATGCYEDNDTGITRMGRQVIAEMNRVGLVVDMSHSGERSTLEAIEISDRPIAITHANPAFWHPALRNKSDDVLKALGESGGMLGFSLYPHHLKDKSDCTLESFCDMVARAAELMGIDHIGIGSDLCQDQPDSVVEWMRVGRWTKDIDYGEGSASDAGFPPMPSWFGGNLDFGNIAAGLRARGFAEGDVEKVMGGNWLRFFEESFGPASG